MRLRCARCGCYVRVYCIGGYWKDTPFRVEPCKRCLEKAQIEAVRRYQKMLEQTAQVFAPFMAMRQLGRYMRR